MAIEVVVQSNFLNQTGNIASIVIANITQTGFYLLLYYGTTKTSGTAGTFTGTLNWNDGSAQSLNVAGLLLSTLNTPGIDERALWCVSGSTISFSGTVTGIIGSPVFDAHLALLRMTQG